ncbi:MAG TPA: ABC transporter permease [Dehalococcoidales bacterium]|nr:ABC transporter permease [Dehalococcoidales bacterium]
MLTYIVRRLLLSVVVLFLVTILSFAIIQIIPGDPAAMMLGTEASPEQIADLRHELYLDRPVVVQYWYWVSHAVQGDLGKSLKYQESITKVIAERMPVTLNLTIMSLLLSVVLGIAAGIICAVRRGSTVDSIVTVLANLGIAVPTFWLGILGIYFFGLKMGWLPIQGYVSPFEDFWLSVRKCIMPVICMAIPSIAVLARQTRSSMLDVIRQDYIRTAWSKGLKERSIILNHALKNALIPIVTLLGLQLRLVVGGSVVVETVFNIAGMGRLIVSSTFSRDFVAIQAVTLIIAIVVLFANLLVDISYGWLDPRIRYS